MNAREKVSMKKFLISTAVAALLLAAPAAFAADNDQNKDKTSHTSDHQSGKAPNPANTRAQAKPAIRMALLAARTTITAPAARRRVTAATDRRATVHGA